jgi:uncharacterized membrane protein
MRKIAATSMSEPPSRLASLRNAFLSGLLLLAPLAITWIVFSALFDKVGGVFRPLLLPFVPESLRNFDLVWNVLATLVVIGLVTSLGLVSKYVLGKYFGGLAERFILTIPGVSTVYNTVKQIVGTFSTQNRNLFSKVVLIEFPRKGMHAIGFLTNTAQGEVQARTAAELWTIFVPTTPNPTSGFLVFLAKEEIMELDMSVGDGMKLIISGGTVTPPWPVAAPPAQAAAVLERP